MAGTNILLVLLNNYVSLFPSELKTCAQCAQNFVKPRLVELRFQFRKSAKSKFNLQVS
jgi:hypothetical protein